MEQVVVITGAAGWLGSRLAERFAAGGARVAMVVRSESGIKKVSSEINAAPDHALVLKADVRSYEELSGAVEETVSRWKRVDVVVNAAGGSLRNLTKRPGSNKPLLEYTEEDWDLVVDTNLKGTFNCLKAAAPQMIKQGGGHIILVCSGQAIKPDLNLSIYAAAKAGVFALAKAAARELGKYSIRVNAVNPGFIPNETLSVAQLESDAVARYTKETVLGRTSTPEEFADFVFYLSQTKNLSGQMFNLDSRILF